MNLIFIKREPINSKSGLFREDLLGNFCFVEHFFLTLETFLENVRPSVPSVRTRPSACLSVSIMRYMYRCLIKYAFSSHRMGFQLTCILINLANGKTPKMLQFSSYLDIFWAHEDGPPCVFLISAQTPCCVLLCTV